MKAHPGASKSLPVFHSGTTHIHGSVTAMAKPFLPPIVWRSRVPASKIIPLDCQHEANNNSDNVSSQWCVRRNTIVNNVWSSVRTSSEVFWLAVSCLSVHVAIVLCLWLVRVQCWCLDVSCLECVWPMRVCVCVCFKSRALRALLHSYKCAYACVLARVSACMCRMCVLVSAHVQLARTSELN